MYTVNPRQLRVQRRVYLPQERVQVNGIGLGEVDGLFNVGKMFKRMTTFTPRSFQPKNIFGAIGSVAMFTGSFGLSSLAPKLTGAHSKLSKGVGMGVVAAAGAIGGGMLLAPMLPAIGGVATGTGSGLMSMASSVGGGIMKVVGGVGGFLKPVMGMFGGGGKSGGGQQQQAYETGYTQAQAQAQSQMQQQQEYDRYIAQQQQQLLYNQKVAASEGSPLGPQGDYFPTMPGGGSSGAYPVAGPDVQLNQPQALMSPEDAARLGVSIDPITGQVIPRQIAQAGMIPELSGTTWLIIGGVTLAGIYFMSDSKKGVGNV